MKWCFGFLTKGNSSWKTSRLLPPALVIGVTVCRFVSPAIAQGVFDRSGGGVSTIADAVGHAFPPITTDSDGGSEINESVAHSDATAFASVDLANAMSHSEFTALSLAPLNSSTFVPQVNSSSINLDFVQGIYDEDSSPSNGFAEAGHDIVANQASASGEFQLDLEDSGPQAEFHGFLYLVADANVVIAGQEDLTSVEIDNMTFVSASITIADQTYTATATYQPSTEDWLINASLPGGVVISLNESSVNRHFDFVVPVSDGSEFVFASATAVGLTVQANGDAFEQATSSVNSHLRTSGLSWGFTRPIGIAPIPGDFDGDGDVDNDDFAIWFINMGIEIGAGGPQGDADLDGDVDSEDLAIWLENTETPGIPGDYNGDNSVDAADYTVWRDTLNSEIDLRADGDLNGIINALDYDVWKTYFGVSLMGSGAAGVGQVVPEPNALVLLVLGLIGATLMRRTLK